MNTIPVFTGTATLGSSPISISSGNVGIGTTGPVYLLDVGGIARLKELQIDYVARLGVSGNIGIGLLDINNALAGQLYGITGGGIQFTNNGGTNTLTLTNGGNIGIGKTPSYPLDVTGQVNSSGGYCIGGSCISSWPTANSNTWSSAQTFTGTTSFPNGDVGIGVAPSSLPLSVGANLANVQGSIAQFTSLSNGSSTSIGAAPAAGWNWAAGSQVIESSPSASGNTVFGSYTGNIVFQVNQRGNNAMTVAQSGNVGIGTTNPAATLEVNGTGIKLTSGGGGVITFPNGSVQSVAWNGVLNGADYAESVDVSGSRSSYEPGDVLILDSGSDSDVAKSVEPYSTLVAGIYATKPGALGTRKTTDPRTSPTEIPMAMVGIVPTKVSAENGPISKGDLLVSSSTPGYAMKGTDRNRMLGAVLGKAMGSLGSGTGLIQVLVTLQ